MEIYNKKTEETAKEYFERRKTEIYKRADYKKGTIEDMEKLKMILDSLLKKGSKGITADKLLEDLNDFFDERGIKSGTIMSTAFVYICELRGL